ncbi:MAG: hypothetical protein SPG06_07155 [Eubacteriales bacterium]|nr:hypothetical protein [Eubacteriales bacterium]
MKRKLTTKILAFTLLITCVVGCCFFLTSCSNSASTTFDNTYKPPVYNTSGQEKNAVIILPGIMGSNLVNAETGVSVWSGGGLMNNLFMSNTATDKEGRFITSEIKKYLKSFLYKDEKGNSVIPLRAATMNDKALEYGLIDEYKNLYNFFEKNLGSKSGLEKDKQYEVVVYQYDWTNSCVTSAEQLEQFIKANKYTNNILVGHSMGGTVIDYYLARNEENRTSTQKVITLGTPHFGAVDAAILSISDIELNLSDKTIDTFNKVITGKITDQSEIMSGIDSKDITTLLDLLGLLLNKKVGLSDIGEIMDMVGGLGSVDTSMILDVLPKEYVNNPIGFVMDILSTTISYLRTMPSVYELLPTKQAFEKGFNGEKPITIDGKTVTYDEYISAIKELDYVKNNAYIKQIVDGLNEKQNSLVIDGKFVTDLVDTHYIAGNGYTDTTTTYSVNLAKKDGKLVLKPSVDNIKRLKSYTSELNNSYGDGMVLVESATAGKTEKVHVLKGYFDHIDLYSPESIKPGSHFLPIFIENEIGTTIRQEILGDIIKELSKK